MSSASAATWAFDVPTRLPKLFRHWSREHCTAVAGAHAMRRTHCKDVTVSRLVILLEKCKLKFKHRFSRLVLFLTTYKACKPFQNRPGAEYTHSPEDSGVSSFFTSFSKILLRGQGYVLCSDQDEVTAVCGNNVVRTPTTRARDRRE